LVEYPLHEPRFRPAFPAEAAEFNKGEYAVSVRVRFAPSPTGHVHIGNIRAAIFNWLFARHAGGSFLLRVEDTDLERSTPEAIESLLDVMRWLGLDYDEEIVYQTRLLPAHQAAAKTLESNGRAYRHAKKPEEPPALYFRIPTEDIEGLTRVTGPAVLEIHSDWPVTVDHTGAVLPLIGKKGQPVPTEICLAGLRNLRLLDTEGKCIFSLADEQEAIVNGKTSVSIPGAARAEFTRREVYYHDVVKGELAKPLDGMKDLVIVRSTGAPVFHLANVCDDISQKITHIVRGDDHVENTYRHLFLFHALGAVPPRYAHLPMIVNQQGKPYSKRDGDAYVGDFRDKGFLPHALFNYLSLLGWSPGDDREKMTREELVAAFTLDRVKSAPAQMDMRKLLDLNRQYVSDLPLDEFLAEVRRFLEDCDWAQSAGEAYFRRVAALMQSRTHVYSLAREWKYYFTDEIEYDEAAVQKNLRKEGVAAALAALRTALSGAEFTLPEIERAIRETERAAGIAEGKMNQSIRVAVTGVAQGAGIYETLEVLGKARSLARLERAASM
jgi:glutamyl-tRNA synthetase